MSQYVRWLVGFMLVVQFALVGCGSTTDTAADVPDEAPVSEVADTEAPVETPVDSEASTDATDDSGASWDAMGFTTKLDQLDSYVVTFGYETTPEGGNAETYEWSQRVNRESGAIETLVNTTSAGSAEGMLRYITVGEANYMVFDETAQCTIINNTDIQEEAASPESIMFANLSDLKSEGAGPDVDGRATDAYSGSFQEGLMSVEMTAYIDREYGIPLQWETKGTSDDNGVALAYTWSYRVSEINQAQTIEIPEACAQMANASAWPMPADAQVSMQTNEMYVYTTSESMDAVVELFANEMPGLGYTQGTDGMSSAEMSMLSFSKGSETVTVVINQQEGILNVIVQTAAN